MPKIIWDKVGDRVFETGLDKGVLYLPDGSAVPWNGLTAIIESFNKESTPVYYDGMKISDLIVLGDFSASMKAVTYPDEFIEFEGLSSDRRGLFYSDQMPQTFALCYRTQVGNDVEGDTVGHKIHILYNVTAIPKDKTYATLTADPSLVEFEWDITAVPEEVPGFSPTAHIILDSREFDPWLLEELEGMLYGTVAADAILLPMANFVSYINDWYRIKIIDNGDGTWTALSKRSGLINFGVDDYFYIVQANAVFLDDVTFLISDTLDVGDVPQIRIFNFGNGLWNATTSSDNIINVLDADEHLVEIRNANVIYLDADTYEISDTED